VFATDQLGFSPEYFAREGGEVYLAGLNSTSVPLPEVATDAKINPEAIKQLKNCATAMMGTLDRKEIEVTRESLVCSATYLCIEHLLTHTTVFPPGNIKWSTHPIPHPQLKARCRIQNPRGQRGRRLPCSRPWRLGDFSISRDGTLFD
jgi:hypothetical protein